MFFICVGVFIVIIFSGCAKKEAEIPFLIMPSSDCNKFYLHSSDITGQMAIGMELKSFEVFIYNYSRRPAGIKICKPGVGEGLIPWIPAGKSDLLMIKDPIVAYPNFGDEYLVTVQFYNSNQKVTVWDSENVAKKILFKFRVGG